jgi:transcriptional regulator with XRE-family HTH domain
MKAKVNEAKIRAWMLLNNLNDRTLAQKIDVSPSTVGRILKSERGPSGKFVQGLWNLGMNPDDIFLPVQFQKDRTKGKKK